MVHLAEEFVSKLGQGAVLSKRSIKHVLSVDVVVLVCIKRAERKLLNEMRVALREVRDEPQSVILDLCRAIIAYRRLVKTTFNHLISFVGLQRIQQQRAEYPWGALVTGAKLRKQRRQASHSQDDLGAALACQTFSEELGEGAKRRLLGRVIRLIDKDGDPIKFAISSNAQI
ncbi:hypothetical protein D3C71_1677640 [compost metagenome]